MGAALRRGWKIGTLVLTAVVLVVSASSAARAGQISVDHHSLTVEAYDDWSQYPNYVDDIDNIYSSTTTLPFTDSHSVATTTAASSASYDFSASSGVITQRADCAYSASGDGFARCSGWTRVWAFDNDTTYSVTGQSSSSGDEAFHILRVQIWEYDPNSGWSQLAENWQATGPSTFPTSSSFTVGEAKGTQSGGFGSMTGQLTGGRGYEFWYLMAVQPKDAGGPGPSGTGHITFTFGPVVPLPGPFALGFAGLAVLGLARWRRLRRR